MRLFLGKIATIALLGLSFVRANAADVARPDAEGYIRDWIMLAPIALSEGDSCAEALLKDQMNDLMRPFGNSFRESRSDPHHLIAPSDQA